MGNLCCPKAPLSYDELVVSEGNSRLDVAVSVDNQQRDAVEETDIAAEVSSERQDQLSYISHPYICDEDVVRHLLLQKTMFIMRGLPGSGKSTLVGELLKRFPKAVVCSADLFWLTPEGEYVFDHRRLKEAHEWCRNNAYQACETGKGHVVIDNTNVKRWEFKYYSDIALRFGYLTFFVEPETPWRFDAAALFSRGTHNVPLAALEAKVQAFEAAPLPAYFGWFLNQIALEALLKLTRSVLAVMEASELRFEAGFPDGAVAERFRLKEEAHVTSMFCDRGRAPGAADYGVLAQPHVGRLFEMRVTALLVTTRTVAAAVQLGEDALQLWNNGHVEELPRGAKAHVTLATASGVPHKEAGDNLVDFLTARGRGETRAWSCADCAFDVEIAERGCLFKLRRAADFSAVFNGRF